MEIRRPRGFIGDAPGAAIPQVAYLRTPSVPGAETLRDRSSETGACEELSRLLREATRLIETADFSRASEKLRKAGELASRVGSPERGEVHMNDEFPGRVATSFRPGADVSGIRASGPRGL